MDGGKTVNTHEGIRRIATVVKAFGWIWLIGSIVIGAMGFLQGFSEQQDALLWLMLSGGCGAIGFAISSALSWIIRGFAQPLA